MTDKRKLEIATLALSEISNGQDNREDMIIMASDALDIIGRDNLPEPGKMIDKEEELVLCECGSQVPISQATIDDDGCWTCAFCIASMRDLSI